MKVAKKAIRNGSASGSAARRHRRSPEELIQDLQRQIEEVKSRAQAREMKQSESVRTTLVTLRNLDKALTLAGEEENSLLRHALSDARKPIAGYLESRGVRLAKVRGPRGRKPKGYSELSNKG